ncbi:unnamed protein product [Arabidopsis arenosa]|uniref:Uncharacterized protein n=1 Tax=Arabidopsis arenosa TaxID=38785 RepID=A0A8S2AX76_ARAAE|nr:unnamed protein product [Arabidopsis arenosa]
MARPPTTASLRPSPSFPKDLRRPPASALSLISPSPPDPPEPPDPPDPSLVQTSAGVVSWSLSVCFVPSLSPSSQISKFLDLSSFPLVASSGALSPSVGSFWVIPFALRHSFTAVCRFYSGFDPANVPTRFDSGFLSSVPTIYLICWLDNGIVSLIRWICVPVLVTFAFMNAMVVYKASMVSFPWLWFDILCHVYSFMEFYILSNAPFGGKRFIVGKKIFFGEARLTLSSLCDMGRWFSIVIEVPLFDGFVRHNVTFTLLAEVRGLKASLEAKDGAEVGCLGLVASWVELVSSPLSLCLSLSYCFCLSFFNCSTNVLVVSLICLALSSLLFPLLIEAKLF